MTSNDQDDTHKLMQAIIAEIQRMKEQNHENEGGFSINATRLENGDFDVDCVFRNDYTKTVMYTEALNCSEVEDLWNLNVKAAYHIADMLISERWLENDIDEDHDDPMGLDDKFQHGGRDDENTDWL